MRSRRRPRTDANPLPPPRQAGGTTGRPACPQDRRHEMTELAIPAWGALGALLFILWRTEKMTQASERLDASVARIAKDVSDVVERIRGNVANDNAAVLADCDKLDAL